MFEYKENQVRKKWRTLLTKSIAVEYKYKFIRSDKSNETITNMVDEMAEEIQKQNDRSIESIANIAKLEGISIGIWIGVATFLGSYVTGTLIRKVISKN